MGGVARLARDQGMQVSGSDANTYPPMSTQLESLDIQLYEGYREQNVDLEADIYIVGNTISRGNPELELILSKGLPYTSGAQWLRDNVLQERWVLAVAGTHGKTTTASMLAWILQDNQLAPGYLIGGVPANFNESARLGETPFFVIEADEYDTAFCDKRSKFVHYLPRTLILNNLEFDHADIFSDLAAIQTQFHHLLKIVPRDGLVIHNAHEQALQDVMQQGCWSQQASFGVQGAEWLCNPQNDDASHFQVSHREQSVTVQWDLIGRHNMLNGLAAIAAAHHVGITIEHAAESLATFKSVKRRLEKIFDNGRIRIYDDFAHHPTAIVETVTALRSKVGEEQILAVLEPRSNTMKQGVHKHRLADSLSAADHALIYADDNVQWDISELAGNRISTWQSVDELMAELLRRVSTDAATAINILIMSNGGFENIHQRLCQQLEQEPDAFAQQ